MNKKIPQTKNRSSHGAYSAPSLLVYGDIGKLTAAGSKGSSEGSMTTDFSRQKN